MKNAGITIGLFMLATFIWALLPREDIYADQRSTYEVINPYAAPDTLRFDERPTWSIPVTIEFEVIVTVYNATVEQCDADPSKLASGKKIDISKAGSYKYCALSRNLLERWGGPFAYGDTIIVNDAKHLPRVWVVHDTMNSRHVNRIDLLVDLGTKWLPRGHTTTIRKGV